MEARRRAEGVASCACAARIQLRAATRPSTAAAVSRRAAFPASAPRTCMIISDGAPGRAGAEKSASGYYPIARGNASTDRMTEQKKGEGAPLLRRKTSACSRAPAAPNWLGRKAIARGVARLRRLPRPEPQSSAPPSVRAERPTATRCVHCPAAAAVYECKAGPRPTQADRRQGRRISLLRAPFSGAAMAPSSQPTLALEPQVGDGRRDHHQQQGHRIAQGPAQFRHVVEIHAINRGDECRRHKHDGNDGENLYDLVLLQVDECQRGVKQEIGLVGEEVRLIS